MMVDRIRNGARAKVAAAERRTSEAMREQQVLAEKRRENSARLRALRLAKEAADAAAEAEAPKSAAKTKRQTAAR